MLARGLQFMIFFKTRKKGDLHAAVPNTDQTIKTALGM
jgi:hypothetical protein